MADLFAFPSKRPADDPALAAAPIGVPVLIGCANRCGRVCSVHWPRDPQLGDLHQELRLQGWTLASAEIAGLPLIGTASHATAPLCGNCAKGEAVRQRLHSGRAPTLRR